MKITGIILAGGKSSRMGKDKSLLEIENKSLTEIIYNKLKNVCSEIIISSNIEENKIPGTVHIHDTYKDIGPIGGIYSSLKKSSNEKNIIVSCDMPFISEEFIAYLIEKSANYNVCISEFNKKLFPFPGIYNKKILNLLKTEIKLKHYKLISLIQKTNFLTVKHNEIQNLITKNTFYNINTTENYKKALKEWK